MDNDEEKSSSARLSNKFNDFDDEENEGDSDEQVTSESSGQVTSESSNQITNGSTKQGGVNARNSQIDNDKKSGPKPRSDEQENKRPTDQKTQRPTEQDTISNDETDRVDWNNRTIRAHNDTLFEVDKLFANLKHQSIIKNNQNKRDLYEAMIRTALDNKEKVKEKIKELN